MENNNLLCVRDELFISVNSINVQQMLVKQLSLSGSVRQRLVYEMSLFINVSERFIYQVSLFIKMLVGDLFTRCLLLSVLVMSHMIKISGGTVSYAGK